MEPPASRPYHHPDDLAAVTRLLLTCRAEERIDPWPPVHEIRLCLGALHDGCADARLWVDCAGVPLAFAMIWEGDILIYSALPRACDEVLEARMICWGMERVRAAAERHGERSIPCIPVRDDDLRRMALLARLGLRCEEWCVVRMQRRLTDPIAVPCVPPGFVLRPVASEIEVPALVDVHHAAFATAAEHAADRVAWMRGPAYVPDLDLVVEAPDGVLAAFCRCSVAVEENMRLSYSAAWIDLIGTRPEYRCRGLGQALVLQALWQMRALGLDRALLGTGSWNTGAQQLFIACGFCIPYRILWYVCDEET